MPCEIIRDDFYLYVLHNLCLFCYQIQKIQFPGFISLPKLELLFDQLKKLNKVTFCFLLFFQVCGVRRKFHRFCVYALKFWRLHWCLIIRNGYNRTGLCHFYGVIPNVLLVLAPYGNFERILIHGRFYCIVRQYNQYKRHIYSFTRSTILHWVHPDTALSCIILFFQWPLPSLRSWFSRMPHADHSS